MAIFNKFFCVADLIFLFKKFLVENENSSDFSVIFKDFKETVKREIVGKTSKLLKN